MCLGAGSAEHIKLSPASGHLLLGSVYGAEVPASTPPSVLLELYTASNEAGLGLPDLFQECRALLYDRMQHSLGSGQEGSAPKTIENLSEKTQEGSKREDGEMALMVMSRLLGDVLN